jgi:hypothetical protein
MERSLIVFILVIVVLFGVLLWAAVKSENAWLEYAKKNCVVVGEVAPSTALGIGVAAPNGQAVTSIIVEPAKTIYSCEGGKRMVIR